jgi:sulfatase maturation enzyme AslB (radical SAM superfamily)
MKTLLYLLLAACLLFTSNAQDAAETAKELEKLQEVQRLGVVLKKENLKSINEMREKKFYQGNAYSSFMRRIFDEALKEDFEAIKNKFTKPNR